MAGTAQIIKRSFPISGNFNDQTILPFEEQIYLNIRDIITDLEVLRAHQAGVNVLLDADTTNTTYVGDAGASDPINAASDMVAATITTIELGD